MDEFEVSRRRFVTGAGAASVGLTVALLPSAVAAASNVGGDGGPITVDPELQGVAVVQNRIGSTWRAELRIGDWIDYSTSENGIRVDEFSYTITGPINSTLTGQAVGGWVPSSTTYLSVSGWAKPEELEVVLTRSTDGAQYVFTVTHQ